MKLYTAAGACAMASDIVLEESGLAFERKLERFDSGYFNSPEYLKVNPMGAVPCLVLDSGEVLTEGVAIMQYVAQLATKKDSKKNLFPAPSSQSDGLQEYHRAMEWMTFISSELHARAFGTLFAAEVMISDPEVLKDFEAKATAQLHERLEIVNAKLAGRDYCLGSQFSAVDAYLFIVLGWAKLFEIDLSPYRNLTDFQARVFQRPSVQRVFSACGMLN